MEAIIEISLSHRFVAMALAAMLRLRFDGIAVIADRRYGPYDSARQGDIATLDQNEALGYE